MLGKICGIGFGEGEDRKLDIHLSTYFVLDTKPGTLDILSH